MQWKRALMTDYTTGRIARRRRLTVRVGRGL